MGQFSVEGFQNPVIEILQNKEQNVGWWGLQYAHIKG